MANHSTPEQRILVVSAGIRALCLAFAHLSGTGQFSARAAPPKSPSASRRLRGTLLRQKTFECSIMAHQAVPRETAELCEQVREQLSDDGWPMQRPDVWSPKCDLVLHPNDASYAREIGESGRQHRCLSLGRAPARPSRREADRRPRSVADWRSAALAHELTHVVLADCFTSEPVPRWIDEGMAILADSDSKRAQHIAGARRAVARGSHFRLAELLVLADYPPLGRWGTFYDQSAAVVEFSSGRTRPREFSQICRVGAATRIRPRAANRLFVQCGPARASLAAFAHGAPGCYGRLRARQPTRGLPRLLRLPGRRATRRAKTRPKPG